MIKIPHLAAIALSATVPYASAVTLLSTGTYDENAFSANTVDNTAPGSISLATFTTDVAAAWAANKGGVIGFDDYENAAGYNGITTSYGVSSSGSLTITGNLPGNFLSSVNAALGTGISGNATRTSYLRSSATTGSNIGGFDMSFGSPLLQLGFTALNRTTASRTITATVYFTDATTASLTDTMTANASPNDDTFFGFAAPSGKGITRLVINPGSTNYIAIDDLGYIVPEPSAALLGALGALALLRRRR